ncbi:hypothetical protein INR49_003658 [Caranx melampygus]|nr:hypothetical protein INR49_003658 [Caranx melampygus]
MLVAEPGHFCCVLSSVSHCETRANDLLKQKQKQQCGLLVETNMVQEGAAPMHNVHEYNCVFPQDRLSMTQQVWSPLQKTSLSLCQCACTQSFWPQSVQKTHELETQWRAQSQKLYFMGKTEGDGQSKSLHYDEILFFLVTVSQLLCFPFGFNLCNSLSARFLYSVLKTCRFPLSSNSGSWSLFTAEEVCKNHTCVKTGSFVELR